MELPVVEARTLHAMMDNVIIGYVSAINMLLDGDPNAADKCLNPTVAEAVKAAMPSMAENGIAGFTPIDPLGELPLLLLCC